MTHASDLSRISVTSAAQAAITRLKEENGDLLFHLPGGCCDARTPVCLPVDELKLGQRDMLIGYADGVPIYEMGESEKPSPNSTLSRATFELGVTNGLPVGFSLSPGDGKCFTLRETRS